MQVCYAFCMFYLLKAETVSSFLWSSKIPKGFGNFFPDAGKQAKSSGKSGRIFIKDV